MSMDIQTSTPVCESLPELEIRRKHILFVDDEPNFLDGLRRMLRNSRDTWDMTFANSVDEAVQLTYDKTYDVIVSDVSMPVKTGLDLLTEMSSMEHTRNIPIIILTGNAESDLKRRALDLGATDLLSKPVAQEDLIARLRSVLRLKSYQDELLHQNEILDVKVHERTRDLEQARRDIIWRLAKAGEYRDVETGDHVIRVAMCCRAIAEQMKLDREDIRNIYLTSPLHDVGKIGIPDRILLKEGPLTPEERSEMEQHCVIGGEILDAQPKGIKAFLELTGIEQSEGATHGGDDLRKMASMIAMTHHEKWNGSGYPNGLKGEDIPVPGLIVAVADVYDALRSERPYKKSFDVEKTVSIMQEGAGSHFAPHVFDTFLSIIDELEEVRRQYAE